MLRADNGYLEARDPNSGKVVYEAATLRCVHCGGHWVPQPGSGRVRGFCARCNGPFCGPGCQKCVPAEQQLENMEAGIDARTERKLILPSGWGG